MSEKILIGCVAWEGDNRYLPNLVESLNQLKHENLEVYIVNNGEKPSTEEAFKAGSPRFKYSFKGLENRGINPGKEEIVNKAIEKEFSFVAFFSPRCRPNSDWIERVLEKFKDPQVGGVATVQVFEEKPEWVYSIGHYFREDGGLYDVGLFNDLAKISAKLESPNDIVWSPCDGASMYRVEALKNCKEKLEKNTTLWKQNPWRNYSCDELGWLLRQNNWKIAIALQAISSKTQGSGSLNPKGVMRVSLELSRVKQLYSHWPEKLRKKAYQNWQAQAKDPEDKMVRSFVISQLGDRNMIPPDMMLETAHSQLIRHLSEAQKFHLISSEQRYKRRDAYLSNL